MRHILALVVCLAAAPIVASAQTAPRPVVVNGDVRERPASGGLAAAVAAAGREVPGVVWIGYAVPATDGDHRMCCWDGPGGDCCGACALEPRTSNSSPPPPAASRRSLEPGRALVVMARLEGGRVERIHAYSETCTLDAGGRVVQWLTGVAPADSVAWLGSQVTATADRRVTGAPCRHSGCRPIRRRSTG